MRPNSYTEEKVTCCHCKHSYWLSMEDEFFCIFGEEKFDPTIHKDYFNYSLYSNDRKVSFEGSCNKFERKTI